MVSRRSSNLCILANSVSLLQMLYLSQAVDPAKEAEAALLTEMSKYTKFLIVRLKGATYLSALVCMQDSACAPNPR